MMKILNSIEEFYNAVEQEGKTVVYFYTKWCPDCIVLIPRLSKLVDAFEDITFYKMNRDTDIALSKHLNIFGIPSFLVYEKGELLGSLVNKKRKSYGEITTFIENTIK